MSQSSTPTPDPTIPQPPAKKPGSRNWIGYTIIAVIGFGLTVTMLVPGGWRILTAGEHSNTRSGRTVAFLESLGYAPSLAIFALLAIGGVAAAVFSYKKSHQSQ